MSLSTAFSIAQNALAATARQTSVVSRNVQNASDPDYNRRSAVLVSETPGSRATVIRRAADDLLFRQNLAAASGSGGQGALADGLARLGLSVNGIDGGSSAATLIGKFNTSLQTFAASPSNRTLGDVAVSTAADVARGLNDASAAVRSFRGEADASIATAVSELKDLLDGFGKANEAVMSATRGNRDASDALDARDAILKKVAGYLPVSTSTRGDNDMVLTTADGVMLFEREPRAIAFSPSYSLDTGTPGGAVFIDGVKLGAPSGGQASGRIAGLLQLRDTVAPAVAGQLDEVARTLVVAFAESDRTGGGAPVKPGLFTWPGAPAMPASGTLSAGLAGLVTVSAQFDTARGGSPFLLRDGGANGAAYVANTGSNASYSALLIGFGEKLATPVALDPQAGLGSQGSVLDASAGALGWFEAARKSAADKAESAGALATRTAEALSNNTGVNVDTEMALMLELEHAYQASARLLKTVDEMLATLINTVN